MSYRKDRAGKKAVLKDWSLVHRNYVAIITHDAFLRPARALTLPCLRLELGDGLPYSLGCREGVCSRKPSFRHSIGSYIVRFRVNPFYNVREERPRAFWRLLFQLAMMSKFS